MAAGSSTLPNKETVTLKLPSGEMVDVVVPAGMSDGDIKSLMQMKRPDLVPPPGLPKPQVEASGNILANQKNIAHGGDALTGYDTSAGSPDVPSGLNETAKHAAGSALAVGSGLATTAYAPAIISRVAPIAGPFIASEAINQARKLPVVGKIIPPGAEIVPFLFSGRKAEVGSPKELPPAAAEEAAPALTEMQQAWKARGGVLKSERPNGPMRGQRPTVATPNQSPSTGTQVALPTAGESEMEQTLRRPPQHADIAMPNQVPVEQRASTVIPKEANAEMGQRIAKVGETKANIEKGETPKIAKPSEVQQQLERALGNEPVKIKPGVPIKNQIATPSGHTEVESSALHSYKYDPNTREFEAHMKGGNTTYVYGDVRPEDVQAFEGAESKGKALQSIRSNPLVGKVVNGKRVAVKPTGPRVATPNDLTPILQESLEAARKKRGQ